MGLLRTIVLGRPDGIRSSVRRMVFGGGGSEDTSPGSAYSAPREAPPPPAEASLGLSPEAPKDVTPPDGFEVVLHREALEPGKVVEIIIGGRAIAVAHTDAGFKACTNSCPHAGGPLGEGELNGHSLTCPYHGWSFDLDAGVCETNGDVEFRTYDVQVVGDAVCVKL